MRVTHVFESDGYDWQLQGDGRDRTYELLQQFPGPLISSTNRAKVCLTFPLSIPLGSVLDVLPLTLLVIVVAALPGKFESTVICSFGSMFAVYSCNQTVLVQCPPVPT